MHCHPGKALAVCERGRGHATVAAVPRLPCQLAAGVHQLGLHWDVRSRVDSSGRRCVDSRGVRPLLVLWEERQGRPKGVPREPCRRPTSGWRRWPSGGGPLAQNQRSSYLRNDRTGVTDCGRGAGASPHEAWGSWRPPSMRSLARGCDSAADPVGQHCLSDRTYPAPRRQGFLSLRAAALAAAAAEPGAVEPLVCQDRMARQDRCGQPVHMHPVQ